MSKFYLGSDLYIKGRIGWRGLSKDEYLLDGKYKIINATALLDGYIDWNNCGFISKERYEESEEIMLKEGDILISKDGTLGKIGYVKNLTGFCTVASGIFVLRNTIPQQLDFDYLYHVLKSNIFKDFIFRNKATGSTINHLYQRDLVNFELELPSLYIQNKIAKVLSILDSKIENNNKIISELEALAKTLYDYWFLQFDFPDENGKPYKSSGGKMVWNEELKKDIPEGWVVKKISSVLGSYPKTLSINTKDYLLSGKYPIIDQSKEYICGYTDNKDVILDMDDCIIFGDHTNFTKYINFKFARGADGTQVINSNNNSLPNYLLYLQINNLPIIEQGYSRHFKFLKEQYIIIPDYNIANMFNTHISSKLILIKNLRFENHDLASLRDFLLPMLMNGQVSFKEDVKA